MEKITNNLYTSFVFKKLDPKKIFNKNMNVRKSIQKRQNNIKSMMQKKIINTNDILDRFSLVNNLAKIKNKMFKLKSENNSNDKNKKKNYTDLYEKIYFGGLDYLNYKENENMTDNNILKKCFLQKNILLNSKYLTPGSTKKKLFIKPFNLSYTKSFFHNKSNNNNSNNNNSNNISNNNSNNNNISNNNISNNNNSSILLEKNIIKNKIDFSNIKINNNKIKKKKIDFSLSQFSFNQKNNSNNNTFRNSYIKKNKPFFLTERESKENSFFNNSNFTKNLPISITLNKSNNNNIDNINSTNNSQINDTNNNKIKNKKIYFNFIQPKTNYFKSLKKQFQSKIKTNLNSLNSLQQTNENILFKMVDENNKFSNEYINAINNNINNIKANNLNDLALLDIDIEKIRKKINKNSAKENVSEALVSSKKEMSNMSSLKAKIIKLTDNINRLREEDALKLAENINDEYNKQREKLGLNNTIEFNDGKVFDINEILKHKSYIDKIKNKIERNNKRLSKINHKINQKKIKILNIYNEINEKEKILNNNNNDLNT